MLLKLLLIRIVPFAALGLCKEREQVRRTLYALLVGNLTLFCVASWVVLQKQSGIGLILIFLGWVPQAVFYLFGAWMMVRCVREAWSKRVWNRIYWLTMFVFFLGALLENYVNPYILQIFFKIFK